jgi:hypothetical protein
LLWRVCFFHCTQENTRFPAAFYLTPGDQNSQVISLLFVFLFSCSF